MPFIVFRHPTQLQSVIVKSFPSLSVLIRSRAQIHRYYGSPVQHHARELSQQLINRWAQLACLVLTSLPE